jgi:hypothetical protein
MCGKKPKGTVQLFTNWASVAPYMRQNGSVVAGLSGGWTILCDDGQLTCTIFDDLALGETLAREFKTTVVSAFGDDTACVYGYRVHSSRGTRAVLVDRQVEQDFGEGVPGEAAVIAGEYNEENVLEVLRLLGIDI